MMQMQGGVENEWKWGGGAGLFESVASYAKAGFIVPAQPQACLDHDDTAP